MTKNSNKLKLGVIISTNFPTSIEITKSGIFQRLFNLIAAMNEACERTLVVFIIAPTIDEDRAQLDKFILHAQNWLSPISKNIELNIFGRDKDSRTKQSFLERYINGIFSILHQPPYYSYAKKGGKITRVYESIVTLDPEIVVSFRLAAAVPWLNSERRPRNLFVDMDDIEHVSLWRRMLRTPDWPSERLRLLHIFSLVLGEYRISRFSNAMLVCSNEDALYLNKIWRSSKAICVPNAVTLRGKNTTTSNGETQSDHQILELNKPISFLFLGTYGYAPNVDAAIYLVEQIWPMVRSALPSAELWIVGSAAHNLPKTLSDHQNVRVMGYVDNLDTLYSSVTVVCAPVRAGSGTRIKILEAAAYGKPIVSTSLGAEGIQLVNERSILIRNSSSTFAAACVELGKSPQRCREIGNEAYSAIEKLYDVRVIQRELTKILMENKTLQNLIAK